eukprot:c21189_g1_i1 orf=111-2885(+)
MQNYLKSFQGVGGLVFGNNEQTAQEDDGGVERLLGRINNGVLAEDRRRAMEELQDVVAESRAAQLAFGAMGLPIILSVLREERSDLDLMRGALETLVNALGSEGNFQSNESQVQPGVLNSELLAREEGSASLLLSLLDEEDFYVRYHTLCLLTMLCRNSSVRLQESVLAIPQGLTRLMDMMQDREVIRNEALLLLTYLTRSAEEIQKIAVFEGVFEKLFNIIVEEGGADGGIVVQDCLDLLNNILRGNPSNQSFLRETLGLQPVASLLKLRKSNNPNFSQQKIINLMCILETTTILLARDPAKELRKDANVIANQTVLAQNNVVDHLVALSVEGRVSSIAVRCGALRCLGDLVHGHARNQEILGKRIIGEEPDGEPALNSVLRVMLHTPDVGECVAAEYVIKCFCEGNPEGQIMLASTITPSLESHTNASKALEANGHMPFGSMLLHTLDTSKGQKYLEASCRAIRVLTHILKGNLECKEKVLRIPLELSASPLVAPEHLLSRCMRYLAAAAAVQSPAENRIERHQEGKMWLQPVMLRLLVIWLADCPKAVASFLEPAGHLPYMVELLTSADSPVSVHLRGLAAVLLGECIIYNPGTGSTQDASMVVDIISQRVGLAAYFERWEALEGNSIFLSATTISGLAKPSTRLVVDELDPTNGVQDEESETATQFLMTTFYDMEFVKLIQSLHPVVRDQTLQLFRHPKTKTILLTVSDRQKGESEANYIERLQTLLQKQAMEMQDLTSRNAALAEELVNKGGNMDILARDPKGSFASRLELETLKQEIQTYHHKIDDMERKQHETEREALYYKQVAEKHEADLKSLSAAYNSLEQENYHLDMEVRNLRSGTQGTVTAGSNVAELEAAREEGRQEAAKESEAELNDLLVCLGQEESKVEKLRSRLEELGEDVEVLLQGIGEEPEGDQDEE